MTTIEDIDPTQALGVALSVQAETMTMGEAQERAPNMLDHLNRMGFDVVRLVKGRDRAPLPACAADPLCYRSEGHDGPHAYPDAPR